MTMIERVARAMVDAIKEQAVYLESHRSLSNVCVDGDVDFLEAARAAIETMRDPTNEMLDAAARGCAARPAVDNETDTTFIWQTMIDAALKITP